MKKISLLLIAAFAMNILINAQGDLDNQFYFRFGPSIPTWKYYGLDEKGDYPSDIKRGGINFEMGNIFMLNGIKLMDGMRLGINVDYLTLNYNRFKSNDQDFKFTHFYWGAKVGPSFTYSPVDKLEFDAYVKYNVVWLSTYMMKAYDAGIDDEDNELYMGFIGSKLSVGFNVRYSVMMMGFEYNPGFIKYQYVDDEDGLQSDDNLGNPGDYNDDGDRTSIPCINVTFGLSF
jgi:hypothetical protein